MKIPEGIGGGFQEIKKASVNAKELTPLPETSAYTLDTASVTAKPEETATLGELGDLVKKAEAAAHNPVTTELGNGVYSTHDPKTQVTEVSYPDGSSRIIDPINASKIFIDPDGRQVDESDSWPRVVERP